MNINDIEENEIMDEFGQRFRSSLLKAITGVRPFQRSTRQMVKTVKKEPQVFTLMLVKICGSSCYETVAAEWFQGLPCFSSIIRCKLSEAV